VLSAWEHVNNCKESHSRAREITLAALSKEAEVGSEEQLAVLTALGFQVDVGEETSGNQDDVFKDI
jgi:hypothetical protein